MKLISNGNKSYNLLTKSKSILNVFNFEINEGCTVIMGPNGCGKSTILKILLGLEKLDSGIVHYIPSITDLASTVLQNYKNQLLLNQTVLENIKISLGNRNIYKTNLREIIQRIEIQMEFFGFKFANNSIVGNLSGGEQQAFVLARAIVLEPKLWIIDEPVSAIDLKRRFKILEMISVKSMANDTLMCTHDLNDAIMIANRLIIFGQDMSILFDKNLPDLTENITSRLNSNWAQDLRKEIYNL